MGICRFDHDWQTVRLDVKGYGRMRTGAWQECQDEECEAIRFVERTVIQEDGDGE